MYLNGKNVLYPRTAEIVLDHINKDGNNSEKMKKHLVENKKIFQYVYSKCYTDIYTLVEKRGIVLQGEFLLAFKVWKDKRKSVSREPQFEVLERKEKVEETSKSEVENEEVEKNTQEKMGKEWPKRKKKGDC